MELERRNKSVALVADIPLVLQRQIRGRRRMAERSVSSWRDIRSNMI